MSHEKAAVSHHLHKFVQGTTVRGVSRVFKTDFLVVRVIWALAVIACASLLLYQVILVTIFYFRYEFSTVKREDVRSSTVSQY